MADSVTSGGTTGRRLGMATYGVLTVAGVACPWYFNIRYIRGLDGPFNIIHFFGDGFANPAGSSLTIDHLIVSVAALTWMVIEGRRLGMRPLRFFLLWSLLVSVASGLPLFLFVRERVLAGRCRRRVVPPDGLPADIADDEMRGGAGSGPDTSIALRSP